MKRNKRLYLSQTYKLGFLIVEEKWLLTLKQKLKKKKFLR